MSSKFDQMGQLVSMAIDRRRHHVFSNVFDLIHFILAGEDDIHKSLNEFEIRRDQCMDYGVGCTCVSEKNRIDL